MIWEAKFSQHPQSKNSGKNPQQRFKQKTLIDLSPKLRKKTKLCTYSVAQVRAVTGKGEFLLNTIKYPNDIEVRQAINIGCCHTDRWVQIGASLPTKRKGRVGKIPANPLQAKKDETRWVQTNMVLTTLITKRGLKMTWREVTRQIRDVIQGKRTVLLLIVHSWFVGLNSIIGITR